MRTLASRAITAATAGVFALTMMSIQPAAAHDSRGDAAALAAFGAIVGTVGAIIAAKQYRDRYRSYYGYGDGYGRPYVPHRHWRWYHRHYR